MSSNPPNQNQNVPPGYIQLLDGRIIPLPNNWTVLPNGVCGTAFHPPYGINTPYLAECVTTHQYQHQIDQRNVNTFSQSLREQGQRLIGMADHFDNYNNPAPRPRFVFGPAVSLDAPASSMFHESGSGSALLQGSGTPFVFGPAVSLDAPASSMFHKSGSASPGQGSALLQGSASPGHPLLRVPPTPPAAALAGEASHTLGRRAQQSPQRLEQLITPEDRAAFQRRVQHIAAKNNPESLQRVEQLITPEGKAAFQRRVQHFAAKNNPAPASTAPAIATVRVPPTPNGAAAPPLRFSAAQSSSWRDELYQGSNHVASLVIDGKWDAAIDFVGINNPSLKGKEFQRVIGCLYKGLKIAMESRSLQPHVEHKILDVFKTVKWAVNHRSGDLTLDYLLPENCEEFLNVVLGINRG